MPKYVYVATLVVDNACEPCKNIVPIWNHIKNAYAQHAHVHFQKVKYDEHQHSDLFTIPFLEIAVTTPDRADTIHTYEYDMKYVDMASVSDFFKTICFGSMDEVSNDDKNKTHGGSDYAATTVAPRRRLPRRWREHAHK